MRGGVGAAANPGRVAGAPARRASAARLTDRIGELKADQFPAAAQRNDKGGSRREKG